MAAAGTWLAVALIAIFPAALAQAPTTSYCGAYLDFTYGTTVNVTGLEHETPVSPPGHVKAARFTCTSGCPVTVTNMSVVGPDGTVFLFTPSSVVLAQGVPVTLTLEAPARRAVAMRMKTSGACVLQAAVGQVTKYLDAATAGAGATFPSLALRWTNVSNGLAVTMTLPNVAIDRSPAVMWVDRSGYGKTVDSVWSLPTLDRERCAWTVTVDQPIASYLNKSGDVLSQTPDGAWWNITFQVLVGWSDQVYYHLADGSVDMARIDAPEVRSVSSTLLFSVMIPRTTVLYSPVIIGAPNPDVLWAVVDKAVVTNYDISKPSLLDLTVDLRVPTTYHVVMPSTTISFAKFSSAVIVDNGTEVSVAGMTSRKIVLRLGLEPAQCTLDSAFRFNISTFVSWELRPDRAPQPALLVASSLESERWCQKVLDVSVSGTLETYLTWSATPVKLSSFFYDSTVYAVATVVTSDSNVTVDSCSVHTLDAVMPNNAVISNITTSALSTFCPAGACCFSFFTAKSQFSMLGTYTLRSVVDLKIGGLGKKRTLLTSKAMVNVNSYITCNGAKPVDADLLKPATSTTPSKPGLPSLLVAAVVGLGILAAVMITVPVVALVYLLRLRRRTNCHYTTVTAPTH